MTIEKVQALCESRGLEYKGKFLKSLSKEEFDNGMRRINLQDEDNLDSLNGEGCWGWYSEEDRKKYNNNEYGEGECILANTPLNYYDVFFWGSVIKVKFNGENRPTLDKEWLQEKVLNQDWYKNE